jgi:hypothetical protein
MLNQLMGLMGNVIKIVEYNITAKNKGIRFSIIHLTGVKINININ